jgi:hypothetical protein
LFEKPTPWHPLPGGPFFIGSDEDFTLSSIENSPCVLFLVLYTNTHQAFHEKKAFRSARREKEESFQQKTILSFSMKSLKNRELFLKNIEISTLS